MRWTRDEVDGKPVWTGCGDRLGRVVGARLGPDGSVEELVVRQDDGEHVWTVEAKHVKRVTGVVLLKGPREGFHIAPIAASR